MTQLNPLVAAAFAVVLTACNQQAADVVSEDVVAAKPHRPAIEVAYQPQPYVQLTHPEWSRNAAMYQINTRQFTEEGTFRAAQEQLPRLKAMGVDILWLMPIHPIGEKNRKGGLGSPYSVKDYYGVNPEFGTEDDFRGFVQAAHDLGMKVILDWVANHSAWDNALVDEHPEWYIRDWRGNFQPTPWWDWSDIIDFDFTQPGLRQYMTEALIYWVREFDIDGYRCDVAGYVPLDFWNNARRELDAVKPVFMLAEWEARDLHAEAFDMTYGWSWTGPARDIALGKAPATALIDFYVKTGEAWPEEAYRMIGTSNHDYNAWEGTGREHFGANLEAMTVLSVVGTGMPVVYNGQEAGNDKRLAFFDRDPIEWREDPMTELYTQLFALLDENTALWHGSVGGKMVRIWTDKTDEVFSFTRDNGSDKVLALFNFSAEDLAVNLLDGPVAGEYRDAFTGEATVIELGDTVDIPAHGWRVLVR